MGVQNATVRFLAVPELTTTVLTMTITGLAADTPFVSEKTARRLVSIGAMLLGALVGGLLVLHVAIWAPLALAAAALVLAGWLARASSEPRP
jgi:uncharacterized membrane protein YoaK (UPF0700 family)